MKILIVNAYSRSAQGQRQFAEFEDIIKQYFLHQKDLMDTETEFFVCDKDNIGDFLYEMSGNYVSKEAAKSFDFIDMVFIEGDANLRPWSASAAQIVMLIKNCLKTNKILWASQFAMQAIVYLISTDLERPINIVNGHNGDPVQNFKSINKQYPTSKNDFFLDNVSGDMYKWDSEVNQWKPVHNTGLHFRKKAQESLELGKLVMKTEIYRPNTQHKQKHTIFEAKNTETICYIKKSLMNHYALVGLEFEFLIPAKNQWDAHPIAFVNPIKTYTVIADSKFTVQIIEPSSYSLACQFNLDKKYPETIQILCNFIKHQLDKVREGKRSIPIKSIVNMNEEEPSSLETLLKIKKNSNQQEEKKKKIEPCFRHSGFALKKLGKQDMMVENNALHPNSVTQLEEIEQFNADVGRQSENNLNNNSMSNGHLNYSSKGFDEHHTSMKFKSRPPTAIHNSSSQSNMFMKRILSAKSTAFSGFTQSNKKEVYMTQKQREEVEEITTKHIKQDLVDERDVFIKNHSEIRLMLHPKLTKEGLPQSENLWAPGSNFQKNLSKSNQLSSIRAMENQTIIKVPSIGPMKKLQMRTQSAATLKSVSGTVGFGVSTKNPNPFIKTENIVMPSKKNLDHEMGTRTSLSHAENEKRKTQNQLDAGFDECRSKPIVRTSGPYLTEKDKEQIIEREQKKYIIGDPLFHTGAVTGYKMMNNILFNDVYNPPSKHQFREFNPQKWVSRNAFFL